MVGLRQPRGLGLVDVGGLVPGAAAADAAGGRQVAWLPDFEAARRWLEVVLRPEDLVLMMGAGNIDALGRSMVSAPPDPALR